MCKGVLKGKLLTRGFGLDLIGPLNNPQRSIRTQVLEQYLAQRTGSTLIQKIQPVDDHAPVPGKPKSARSQDSGIPAPLGEGQVAGKTKLTVQEDLFKGIIRRLEGR